MTDLSAGPVKEDDGLFLTFRSPLSALRSHLCIIYIFYVSSGSPGVVAFLGHNWQVFDGPCSGFVRDCFGTASENTPLSRTNPEEVPKKSRLRPLKWPISGRFRGKVNIWSLNLIIGFMLIN